MKISFAGKVAILFLSCVLIMPCVMSMEKRKKQKALNNVLYRAIKRKSIEGYKDAIDAGANFDNVVDFMLGLSREDALQFQDSLEFMRNSLEGGLQVPCKKNTKIKKKPKKTKNKKLASHYDDVYEEEQESPELLNRSLVSSILDDNVPGVSEAIRRGANVNYKDSFVGDYPLHSAVKSPEITELLLQAGALVNARSDNGSTPLHKAASKQGSSTEVVRLLLEAGADSNSKDKYGATPAQVAKTFSRYDILDALANSGVATSYSRPQRKAQPRPNYCVQQPRPVCPPVYAAPGYLMYPQAPARNGGKSELVEKFLGLTLDVAQETVPPVLGQVFQNGVPEWPYWQ